jgi:hypothetical protein
MLSNFVDKLNYSTEREHWGDFLAFFRLSSAKRVVIDFILPKLSFHPFRFLIQMRRRAPWLVFLKYPSPPPVSDYLKDRADDCCGREKDGRNSEK